MAEISKQEYAKTIDTYIASKIETFPSPDNPSKWEWAFIDGMPKVKCRMPENAGSEEFMGLQPDLTRFNSPHAALKRAIVYVKEYKLDAYTIAQNETNEWMKHNNHTMK